MNVLITGSSKGLGAALALKFAHEGYGIILHGRDKAALRAVGHELSAYGVKVETVFGDLRDDRTINHLYKLALKNDIGILINNAGAYYCGPASGTTPAVLDKVIGTNLIAPIRLSLLCYPIFLARGGGLIININSLASKGFNDMEAAYCASKWGLRGFSQSIRDSATRCGVRILDVYLGAMKTNMVRERSDWNDLIDPADVADEIYRLCALRDRLNVTEIEIRRKA